MKKFGIFAALTAAFTAMTVATASAGTWEQQGSSWLYRNDAGQLQTGWAWIDGNQDGTAESYYFDGNGYLLTNTTTPDGYTVNADGAWVQDGTVQTTLIPMRSDGWARWLEAPTQQTVALSLRAVPFRMH